MTSVISLGNAAAGLGLPEGSVDQSEFNGLFRRWVSRQARIERELGEMFGLLSKWVALGVARCDQLQRYNNRALGIYAFSQSIRQSMVQAGLDVPAVPRPHVFGSRAVARAQGGIEVIEVTLDCDGAGFAKRSTKIDVCAVQPSQGQLGVAPAVLIGWATIIVAVGVSSLFLSSGWEKFIRNLPSNVFNEMQKEVQRQTLERDVRRLRASDSCYEKSIRGLSQKDKGNLDLLRELKRQCDERAESLIPKRAPPDLERPEGLSGVARALFIGGAAISGTAIVFFMIRRAGRGSTKAVSRPKPPDPRKQSREEVRRARAEERAARARRKSIEAEARARRL